MAEPRRAGPDAARPRGALARAAGAVRIRNDIVDDIVGTVHIVRHSAHAEEVIHPQIVANAPGNVMIGAGSIAANANTAPMITLPGP